MKVNHLVGAIIMPLFVVSCSQQADDSLSEIQMKDYTIQANAPETKVGFDQSNAFYWSKGDAIGVNSTNSSKNFSKMELSGDYGQARATFKGVISGEPSGYAVYPYVAMKHKMNGTELTYNLRASYSYTHVDKDYYAEVQGEGNSFNPMMWGAIVDGGINFKHLGGMIAVVIEQMPSASGTIALLSDMRLTGNYVVDLSVDVPEIIAESNGGDYSEVSISFSGATVGEQGVFYFPAPTGTYPEIWVQILDENGTEYSLVPFEEKIVNRTKIRVLRIKEGTIEGGQMSLSDWNTGADEGGSAE